MKYLLFLFVLFAVGSSQELKVHLSDRSVYSFTLSEIDTITFTLSHTQADYKTDIPVSFNLYQNYPNPFNPSTTISYQLPASSCVTISIYNLKGRLIKTIINSEVGKGTHLIQWYGKDQAGNQVASGLYFYVIQANRKILSKKMILIK